MKANRKVIIFILILLILLVIIIGLSTNVSQEEQVDDLISYSFQETNLPSIDTGHYALWGYDLENKPKLIKRFTAHNGTFRSLDGSALSSINVNKEFSFEKYEVTVESTADRDELQSGCTLLEGHKSTEGIVSFTISAIDYNNLSGQFILATPTDKTSETNEESGVWFTKNITGAQTEPSLNLGVLPSCWIWASYFKYRDEYLRVGRFNNPNEADNFADYSYFQAEPLHIVGEDYFLNLPNAPLKLNGEGNELVVAIEPREAKLRLKLKHEPFVEVLKYEFDGNEKSRQPIELKKAENLRLVIEIN